MVSLIACGGLSLIGIYWRPLHAPSAVACLFAAAIGCLANWRRNRSFHCAITGPLFLIAGVVFLLSGVRMIHVNAFWVWPFVFHRSRQRVSVGMAVCEAFCGIALRMRMPIPGDWSQSQGCPRRCTLCQPPEGVFDEQKGRRL